MKSNISFRYFCTELSQDGSSDALDAYLDISRMFHFYIMQLVLLNVLGFMSRITT
ncbi:CLUMA_CG005368, isoform A [Clunio marinus]|uniref:CLUMA_CG005368, isoform A n=1 Tax=Clunio marinus TaxID=568069 RepID=A0A1J1HUQ3_9DIPT|nr:CLUMA_CG005368, isoform A [Clunio marinus]